MFFQQVTNSELAFVSLYGEREHCVLGGVIPPTTQTANGWPTGSWTAGNERDSAAGTESQFTPLESKCLITFFNYTLCH